MTDRIKAATISLLVIVCITGLKFVLYYISGSIAVLSEAWHSFSDIATTLLVLASIYRQQWKAAPKSNHSKDLTSYKRGETYLRRFSGWFGQIDTELKIAGVISLLLLTVSILILWRAVFSTPVTIEMPLVTGIIFVGLSLGSFFLYRFQDTIGREGNSAALRADSLHNRADMAISLLTGVSLIIYHFGYDIDRWVSVYIAIFIFSFATEMFVNVLVSIFRGGRQGLVSDYRFSDICRAAFQPDTYARVIDPIIQHLPISKRRQTFLHKLPLYLLVLRRWSLVAVFFGMGMLGLRTMIYTVDVDEEAMVLRYGQIIQSDQTVGPGLHWKLPWPIDRVVRFQTGKVFSLPVGNVADLNTPMIWRNDHGDTQTFISGDNSLFLPYLTIHYRIKNPRSHYLNYRNGAAGKLLAFQAYRILSQTFAHEAYFDISLFKRRQWTSAAESELQATLDSMNAGIEIVAFCLRDLHPPRDIAASYEDVVAAYQKREKSLNQAKRYYNIKLPEARSAAQKMLSDVQAAAASRLKLAEGEAENYRLRLEGFKADREIGKDLLIYETAEKNLKDKKLFLIDPESGIDTKMVYFENHLAKEQIK